MNKNGLPFEEAAEIATLTGWVCKTCRRYYGPSDHPLSAGHGAEHMARWCCASSLPCSCGGRITESYTICDACREKKTTERWLALPELAWDGDFPICIWDSDTYFFDIETLEQYADDLLADGGKVEDIRLSPCRKNKPREFEVNDYLSDDLAEDDDLDGEDIDKIVNDWIAANVPALYFATGERLSKASFPDIYNRVETGATQ